eukprot:CAMPEP_0203860428 /NCGR_PEP_ID=MMETSP0359-20131031/12421_1 /ASSEMBLY_ACC=CAM_ASM_000338 /TAXON_ID=268821 /ORGANISM="Scrippsiella Hangoei, Strain SHTV-5" /LENGTH=56 /DNA_ID=CAMNT_0050777495 /DNA_START=112 /DNA_END=279 /DNA_ORIENTATION=+
MVAVVARAVARLMLNYMSATVHYQLHPVSATTVASLGTSQSRSAYPLNDKQTSKYN